MHTEIGILADPAKQSPQDILRLAEMCVSVGADFILIGGTHVPPGSVSAVLRELNLVGGVPVGLFPGLDHPSVSLAAGADFFLSPTLMGSEDPFFTGGWHRQALGMIRQHGLQPLPMGYLLVRDGTRVPVHRGRELAWIRHADVKAAVDLAGVAEVTGQRAIYLEAGSGAERGIAVEMIEDVCAAVSIPVIVGGGLRSPQQIEERVRAGARAVIVGNAIQERPDRPYVCDLVAAAHIGNDQDRLDMTPSLTALCNPYLMSRTVGIHG